MNSNFIKHVIFRIQIYIHVCMQKTASQSIPVWTACYPPFQETLQFLKAWPLYVAALSLGVLKSSLSTYQNMVLAFLEMYFSFDCNQLLNFLTDLPKVPVITKEVH